MSSVLNKNLFCIFLFLLTLIGCNKTDKRDYVIDEKKDSLTYFFDEANKDSLPFQKRRFYTQKALDLISNEINDSLNRVNYFKVANRYFNMNALEDYKKISFQLVQKSIESKDTLSLIKAYSYLTDYYVKKSVTDSAYMYNYKVEKLYRKLDNRENVALRLLNKAILQHNESDYLGCERSVFEALKMLKGTRNSELFYQANNLLGIIYAELKEYDLSHKYYKKALEIAEKDSSIPPNYHFKATTLNNLGNLYRDQNKIKESIEHLNAALRQENLYYDIPNTYAMVKDNLAYSKFKLGDYSELPDLFLEALEIRDSLNNVPGIILNNVHLSEYYAVKRDTLKAIEHARKAYDVACKHNEIRDILFTLKQLSNVEPEKAHHYSAEYYKINDSLQISERKTRNKFARIEYETEELVLEKEKLVEQRKTLIYIGLGIILIGIFIYVIRSQAARNRELQLLQEQQQANEEIYQLMLNQQDKIEEVRQLEKKRIAQDLHDGILGKLFGTRLNLGILNSEKNEDAIESRSGYIEQLKMIEQEIREISHDLNSEKTAIFNNFVLMVSNFIENQRSVCKAEIKFTMDPLIDWNGVDNVAKINFYRILQEAFQNINKYAEPKNVSVTFAKNNSTIELEVRDDGIGFNYLKKKKGIGLQNMQTRIDSSGGTMTVKSEVGIGTVLKFELPI